ncbi:hypothetical protein B296_00035623 [Ensete ventricosum]|uniref:Uncharacterized protein n=1 Tax=Ensete ventricosum TaxID=4639 RepID=A0A427A525_ENSVE|nr:hypothetical protein B296_00035623 [Ensete ventricosum]
MFCRYHITSPRRGEHSEEGWPTTAIPHVGVASHGQTPCWGVRPRLGPLQGQSTTAKAPCEGQSPTKGGWAARGQGQL